MKAIVKGMVMETGAKPNKAGENVNYAMLYQTGEKELLTVKNTPVTLSRGDDVEFEVVLNIFSGNNGRVFVSATVV